MSEQMPIDLDLGHDHSLSFVGWSPDRDLNPQYDHLPDVERWGASIHHPAPEGASCRGLGMVTFDGPVQRELEPDRPRWQVESEDPLTLSPSVLCTLCGDHGFIREGRWVPA